MASVLGGAENRAETDSSSVSFTFDDLEFREIEPQTRHLFFGQWHVLSDFLGQHTQ